MILYTPLYSSCDNPLSINSLSMFFCFCNLQTMKTAFSFVLLATAAFSAPVGLVPASTVANHGASQAISQAHSAAGGVQGELVVEQTEPNPLGLSPEEKKELDILQGKTQGIRGLLIGLNAEEKKVLDILQERELVSELINII
jgi:hypothetical protein